MAVEKAGFQLEIIFNNIFMVCCNVAQDLKNAEI